MKPYQATKPCMGWGHKFRGVPRVACPAAAQVPNVSRYKRCPGCAAAQHRLVVNASHKRNWPKYLKRRKLARVRRRPIVAAAREALRAAA